MKKSFVDQEFLTRNVTLRENEAIKKLEDYIEKIQNKDSIKVLISDDDTFKNDFKKSTPLLSL